MYSGFNIRLVKDTTISFKLEKSVKAKLVTLAKAENRSLSNFIEKVLKEEISRSETKRCKT
jgi:predicted transcriptional regulator